MTKKTIKFNLKSLLLFSIFFIGICISLMGTSTATSISTAQNPQCSTINESWGDVQLVSTGSVNDSQNPTLVSDGLNNIFVAWDELNETASLDDYDINLRIFNSSIASWKNTQIISRHLNEESRNPDIAIDSNNKATIVWQDPSDNGSSYYSPTIFYSSQNLDDSWTKPQNITHTNSSNQRNPSLCFEGTTAHLVWNEQNQTDSNNNYINYSRNFLAGQKIVSSIGGKNNPQIISDPDGILHVVGDYYSSYSIFHISYDGSWSTITEVGDIGAASKNPQLALDSQDNLHILWDDHKNIGSSHDLEGTILNKSSGTWKSFGTLISQENVDPIADIAIDNNGSIHIVWISNPDYSSGGDNDIYYKRYDVIEASWTEAQLVSEGSTNASTTPLINIDNDRIINIIWVDETGDYLNSGSDKDIFMRRLTFSEPSGNGDNLIPGYDFYIMITVLGIASLVLLIKKFQS